MKKIAIFTLVLIITCGQAFAGTLTVALFDLSGSVFTDNTGSEGKDAPYNKNIAELKKEINKLNKGDTIIVIGFARKSDVVLLKATMPKQAGPMKRNLIATREAALRKLDENIASKTKSINNSKTDIVGSLFRASRLIAEANLPESTERKLFIYSDMLDNETIGLSFNKLKNNKVCLQSKVGFPDLKGVEVNIYSAFSDIKGVSTVQTEIAIKNLKAFWTDYFLKSGSVVKLYRTSY